MAEAPRDYRAEIEAAAASGNTLRLAMLAAELVGENEAMRAADEKRRADAATRQRRHRNAMSRDVTSPSVTERDVTDGSSPLVPPSPLAPTPPLSSPPYNPPSPSPVAAAPGGLGVSAGGVQSPPPSRPPRKRGESAPWMASFAPVWRSAYGGEMPKGSATFLRPVIAAIGEAEAVTRFALYCAETKAPFATVAKFAQTHGAYSAEGRKTAAGKSALEELQRLGEQDDWWVSGLKVAS